MVIRCRSVFLPRQRKRNAAITEDILLPLVLPAVRRKKVTAGSGSSSFVAAPRARAAIPKPAFTTSRLVRTVRAVHAHPAEMSWPVMISGAIRGSVATAALGRIRARASPPQGRTSVVQVDPWECPAERVLIP